MVCGTAPGGITATDVSEAGGGSVKIPDGSVTVALGASGGGCSVVLLCPTVVWGVCCTPPPVGLLFESMTTIHREMLVSGDLDYLLEDLGLG